MPIQNNYVSGVLFLVNSRQYTILIFLFLLFAGCNKSEDTEIFSKNVVCINSDQQGYRSMVEGSASREYILYVPASYDSSAPAALIINFHGYGGCAADFSKETGELYGLYSLADSENFLLAYPQALIGEKGDAYWDPADKGSQDIEDNDVYFTERLIADIKKDYNVDLSRVYACGYSNGGMMSYGLACTRPDLIAAIGIMSGTMLQETCNANEYTSVIIFHGIADFVLPYYGNEFYQSVPAVVDFWLNHNNIPGSGLISTPLNAGAVIRDVYNGGNENTSVVLYTIHNEYGKPGGHVWFSQDIEGDSPNKLLWDFLSAFSLDD